KDWISENHLKEAVRESALLPYDPLKNRAKLWSPKIEKAITENRLLLGMTSEQVTLVMGKPMQINQTGGHSGSREQWVYTEHMYLYFENGVLTGWQASRLP